MKVINAENMIAGRLATKIAKLALEGETVNVVNSEKAVISGGRETILNEYFILKDRGDPHHGPEYPRRPERMLRRIVRNMVNHKSTRGRNALARVKTYIGVPEEFKSAKMESYAEADVKKLKKIKYIKLGEISRWLGSKW